MFNKPPKYLIHCFTFRPGTNMNHKQSLLGVGKFYTAEEALTFLRNMSDFECAPINIFMKEGKGKLKHFKNLIKENEICTMKCIDKICHNDQSFMLMHFICII